MIRTTGRHSASGVTLLELIIVSCILGMILVSSANFFRMTQSGLAMNEAHQSLRTAGQQSVNRMERKLEQSRRIFDKSSSSDDFRQRLQLSSGTVPFDGSVLPGIEKDGSLSPSSPAFVTTSVGTSLMFAGLSESMNVTALDSGAVNRTVRIDIEKFHYFFLSSNATQQIEGQPLLVLWEWHSQPHADYNQITSLGDATLKENTIKALFASGVMFAWDSSATDVNAAFYDLGAMGLMTQNPAHLLQPSQTSPMIQILTGTMSAGFKYSVSPDGSGVQDVPPASFSCGFGVVTVGSAMSRQVLLRLVLNGKGAFKGIVREEKTATLAAKDVW